MTDSDVEDFSKELKRSSGKWFLTQREMAIKVLAAYDRVNSILSDFMKEGEFSTGAAWERAEILKLIDQQFLRYQIDDRSMGQLFDDVTNEIKERGPIPQDSPPIEELRKENARLKEGLILMGLRYYLDDVNRVADITEANKVLNEILGEEVH